MNKIYKHSFLSFLFLGTFLLTAVSVQAQQVSDVPGGPFNQADSWVNGVPTNKEGVLTISVDSEIIHYGDFSWNQKVVVDGTFNIVGNYTVGHGGVEVTGSLFIDGVLSQGNGDTTLTVKNGGRVVVQSVTATHPIRVEAGGELIVNGDYLNSQPIHIEEGGRLYIAGDYGVNNNYNNGVLVNYGDVVVLGAFYTFAGSGLSVLGYGVLDIGGDLNAKQAVRVALNAVLLVRGSVYYEASQTGMEIEGIMVVAEDFRVLNGYISTTGKVVVGGALTVNVNGGFSSPDQQGTGEANLYLLDDEAGHYYRDYDNANSDQSDNKSGKFSDFKEHEGESDLWDWVASVLPDVVNPGQSNRVYKWVGALNSDWYNRVNWNGRLPGYGVKVLIQAGRFMPVIKFEDGLIELKDLTIEADANLTLNPGGKLTVNGDLVIEKPGGLILESKVGPNGLASLITEGSVSGEANVQLTLPREEWYYISHPIESARTRIYDVFMPGSTSENFRDFSHIAVHRNSKWYRVTGENVSLWNLEGVSVKYTLLNENRPMHTLNYTGRLNNDPIPRDFSSGGFYLFGNPYASSIDWEAEEGWSRSDIDGTIWYRTRVSDEMAFVTYNRFAAEHAKVAVYPDGMSSVDQSQLALIPPMQSVWIKANRATTFSVSPEVREHNEQGAVLKSTKRSENADVIRIVAENKHSKDGAVVYFWSNSIDELDRGDSEKRFNDSELVPEVYTRVDKMALSINGFGELSERVKSIPLSVRNRVAGDVSLSFDLSHFYGEHAVYFEDKTTGAFLNVARNSTYEYSVKQTGEEHERFVLHLYKVSTDLEEVRAGNDEIAADEEISIKSIAGKVLVSVNMDLVQQDPGKIEIYTIDGRKISEVPARSGRTLVMLSNQNGVYIVRAKFGNLIKSERVLVSEN